MKISYLWLQQFLNIDFSPEKIGEILTDLGLEVEGIEKKESVKGNLLGVVVGEVITCIKHPNADNLKLTTVDIGIDFPIQIVCGASNVDKGQKVPVATVGTILYNNIGDGFKIKKTKIRGKDSYGMICAEDELGLGKKHEGIMILDNSLKVGVPCSNVFNLKTDYVFEIGLTPNRSDAMSHYGVARDLYVGLLQNKEINLKLISPSVSNFYVDIRTLKIDVDVKNKDLISRYCGITITNIEVKESPGWIKERLNSIGITPKNNVVDITNYVLHELGQPLHAFDTDKIIDNKIIVGTVEEGTKFITLDEVERKLSSDDIVICDGNNTPLCIGGILGGLESGVTKKTTSIFLESACFNSISIRKTAKKHGLNTDSSFRFERGIDIAFCKYALKRACLLIQKYAGGKISSDIFDFYPTKKQGYEVFLSYENTYKLIGQEISKQQIKNILVSLEIKINSVTDRGLGLLVPYYRVDVRREADVIEEILRVYGYNNIKFSNKLNTSISFDNNTDIKIENIIANQLSSIGFNEIMSNSLTKPEYVNLNKSLKNNFNVEILNPLSNDLKVMRQSLLFSGLESIIYNINRKNNSLKFYEFGKSYHKFESAYQENKHLTIFITGERTKNTWNSTLKSTDFFYLKGVIKTLLSRLGIENIKNNPVSNDVFSEGISFVLGKIKIVDFGVVKRSLLKEFGIKQEVLYADFNWSNVLLLSNKKNIELVKLSKFPSVKRDLSLLIDEKIKFDQIYNLAFQVEKKLLKEVDLFDVYKGENLPQGKKSYAVSFILQDENKTLKDNQIDKIMYKIQQTLEKKLNAELR